MRRIIALVLAGFGLLWFQARAEDPKKENADAAKLVGAYEAVAGERGGQKISADRLKDIMVRIAVNAITTFDKDEKKVYAATYELDTSRQPWRITMTATLTPVNGKGAKAEGLIKVDGDSVKLIYALPGGKAPTDFKTGEKQQMFVLKRTGK
jgi:uncharacterized protein (TIGR03067 family)